MSILANSFKPTASLCLSYSPTLTTISPLVPDIGIKKVKGMTIQALRGCLAFGPRATPYIYLVGHCLKVIRIYAQWLATKMVNLKFIWNNPNSSLICKAMSSNIGSPTISSPKIKQSIAMTISPRFPKPAFIRGILFNFCPKTFLNAIILHSYILPRNGRICQWV